MLKPENKAQLTKVLTYHVVPGKVMSRDISGSSPRRGVGKRSPGADDTLPAD